MDQLLTCVDPSRTEIYHIPKLYICIYSDNIQLQVLSRYGSRRSSQSEKDNNHKKEEVEIIRRSKLAVTRGVTGDSRETQISRQRLNVRVSSRGGGIIIAIKKLKKKETKERTKIFVQNTDAWHAGWKRLGPRSFSLHIYVYTCALRMPRKCR